MDIYEELKIKNKELPERWQSQQALDELEEFLQQNWAQRSVLYEDKEVKSKQQFLEFLPHGGVRTNNYIGTITFLGEQLNIYPKVFKQGKDDDDVSDLSQKHLMRNLIRWLEYCSRAEYPFINVSTELVDADNLKDLFVTLFVGYLRSTLERGMYYRYVDETADIKCIKGKFDVKDYMLNKIPNGQANLFKCTYSNFEFDNNVNRIIKYTCNSLIKQTDTSVKNQVELRKILIRLNEVSDVPCKPSDCDHIRLSKMHSRYNIIISMCKMFLMNKTTDQVLDSSESFCFLFPTELLFEGFIGGFMRETMNGYKGKVSLQKSDKYLIDEFEFRGQKAKKRLFNMKLDILTSYKDKLFILDTKYKEIPRFEGDADEVQATVSSEVSQGDLYQVCEYASKYGNDEVYLLYPMYRYEEADTEFPAGYKKIEVDGEQRKIKINFVRLPFIFEEDESKLREPLIRVIKQLFSVEEENE